jgi:hypothetical protein
MFQNQNINHLLIHRDGDDHLVMIRDLMFAVVPVPIRNLSPDALILCLLLINFSLVIYSNAEAYYMTQAFSIAISESIVDSAIFWLYSLFQLANTIINYSPSYFVLQLITICSQVVIVMGCASVLLIMKVFEKKIAHLEQELKKYKELNEEISATNKDN